MRTGFFHFGCPDEEKGDPVGSLESELENTPDADDSLIVLPEAFNARGGYYRLPVDLDESAAARLQAISVKRHIAFVVGWIDAVKGYNSAYLIDGTATPVLLSRKRCGGWPQLYTKCETDEDNPVLFRDVVVTARICEDAGDTGPSRQPILDKIAKIAAGREIIFCIPSYMGTVQSRGVAPRWKDLPATVVIANGSLSQPSVILRDGAEKTSDIEHRNQIKFGDA